MFAHATQFNANGVQKYQSSFGSAALSEAGGSVSHSRSFRLDKEMFLHRYSETLLEVSCDKDRLNL